MSGPGMFVEMVEALCAAGLLERATPVALAELQAPLFVAYGVVAALDGVARVEGVERRFRIGLPRNFPDRLPIVFVLDPLPSGRLPHVHEGRICFDEQEGVLLDRDRPVEIVREALSRAIETLRRGLTGENRDELIDTLPVYWPGESEGIAFFPAGEEIRPIFRCVLPWAGTHAFVVDREQARQRIANGAPEALLPVATLDEIIDTSWCRGLYIPLSGELHLPEPLPLGRWTSSQLVRLVRRALSPEQTEQLDAWTRSMAPGSRRARQPWRTFVVLRVPRPRGGEHLVGIRYDNIQGGHPLGAARGTASVTQFRIERRDPGYLMPRGGAARELGRRRVLLVGCGAIGGHLAGELVRSGVGRLTLVDPDLLRPENAYRHVLGVPPPVLLPWKAMLLASELKQRYPAAEIEFVTAAIEDALAAGLDPSAFDLMISATGEHNVDRALNERLFHAAGRPPLIFTWLEPQGLGGHALRVLPATEGCFECLFTPFAADDAPALANRAAFAAPGQVFTRELAGCGNAFTPYSSLDAVRTAALAARFAVETLEGDAEAPSLRSWKGDARAFRQAGFRTSPRYELDAGPLESPGIAVAAPDCPVCGRAGGVQRRSSSART